LRIYVSGLISIEMISLKAFINYWFNGKDDLLLFCLYCVTGIAASVFGARLLDSFEYNFGKNVAGLFIPPLFCVFFLSYSAYRYHLHSKVLIKTLLLYCFQILPYVPLFLQAFRPTGEDDFYRYYLYAKNMVDNHTLWGGDQLFFEQAGYHYVTQPGYRYFIYLELVAFKDLYRFVPFINIGLYIIVVYLFQKAVFQTINSNKLKLAILILILLFTPYIIKNLLMGLPEWFTILLLMYTCYLYLVPKKRLLCVFVLGLVPFFRQNLLIAVVLLFVWMLWNNRKWSVMTALFLLPLMLPLYHNLYFAGEWRFFVDIFQLPFLNYEAGNDKVSSINYSLLLSNIIHYFGFDLENGRIVFSMIAALFLPFATVLYFYFIKQLHMAQYRLLFVIITTSAIAPVILFGNAYYPRFEVVNVAIALISFLLLYAKQHLVEKPLQENSITGQLTISK